MTRTQKLGWIALTGVGLFAAILGLNLTEDVRAIRLVAALLTGSLAMSAAYGLASKPEPEPEADR